MRVNKRELADILGKTERTLTTYQKQGMPIAQISGRGKASAYETTEVIDWLIQREITGLVNGDGDELDLMREKTRLTHHQANIEEMRERQMSGDLLESAEVERVWSDMVMAARARLLALPVRAAQASESATTTKEVEQYIRDQVFEALRELENAGEDTSESAEEVEPTAGSDGGAVGSGKSALVAGSERGTGAMEQ